MNHTRAILGMMMLTMLGGCERLARERHETNLRIGQGIHDLFERTRCRCCADNQACKGVDDAQD